MKKINDKDMIRALKYLTEDLKIREIHPGFHFMDNEPSTALKLTMTTMNIKYQLVLPSNHRAKNAERAIKEIKKYFIAGLCNVDKYLYFRLWDRLLQQTIISIKLIRQSRTLPQISGYNHIFA